MKKFILIFVLSACALAQTNIHVNNIKADGSLTVTGASTLAGVTVKSLQNVFMADQYCGGSTDLDVCVNAAYAACVGAGSKQCTVFVPNNGASGWNMHGTINLPNQNQGSSALIIDHGAVLNELCINNCDAIALFATGADNDDNNVIVGGRIVGNAQAGNCLHFRQVSRVKVEDVECSGFSNKSNIIYGNGELNEGVVTLLNINVLLDTSNIGLQNVGYGVGPGTVGPTNNVQFIGGRIQSNITGGVFENGSCTVACSFPNENNSYFGDIEGNGTNPVTTAALSATMVSNIVTVTGAGTTQNITPGTIAVQSGFGAGIAAGCVNGRFAVLTATASTYTYACTAANATSNGGSVTGQKYQVWVENGNGITLYPTFMQWGSAPAGFEAPIELGDTTYQPTGTNIRNAFLSSVGSTNSIFAFSQKGTLIDGVTEFNAVTKFLEFGTGAQGPVQVGMVNSAAGTFVTAASVPVGSFVYDQSLPSVEHPSGSAAKPSISFVGETTTGFYWPGAGGLNWSIQGSTTAASTAAKFSHVGCFDVSFFGDSFLCRQGANIIEASTSATPNANAKIAAADFIGPIGNTTPAAGHFTTLSTTGAFTGASLTSPAINGTPTGTGIPTVTLKKGSGAGNYTTASTTYVVTDATNLCYTVTIPTGWKLLVTTQAEMNTATAAVTFFLALTDNAACSTANAGLLAETTAASTSTSTDLSVSLTTAITGDGAAHNIALQYKTSNGADSATVVNSTATRTAMMTFLLTPSN